MIARVRSERVQAALRSSTSMRAVSITSCGDHACGVSPAWLWAHLRAVLDDAEQLRDLAERADYHPSGFAKIVLLPEASPRLRLHVWHPDKRAALGDNDVHGHRCAFSSWIITGRLRETTYVEGPRGRPFDVYRFTGADRDVPFEKVGTGLLTPSETTHRTRGEIYTREPLELHTTEPLSPGLVATL